MNLRESLAGLEGPGPRRQVSGRPVAPGQADDLVFPSKALRKFLAGLTSRESPVVIDLGPVIPGNVNFFCEQLGCKVFVEDVCAELERHVRQDRRDALPEFLKARFSRPAESVDGVLCWDVLDYLEKQAAQTLADQLTKVLRPDGVLLGFFGNLAARETQYTKYIVADEGNLRHRSYAATCRRQASWPNRDIIRLFSGLRVSDSFLLKNNQREILFRKPA